MVGGTLVWWCIFGGRGGGSVFFLIHVFFILIVFNFIVGSTRGLRRADGVARTTAPAPAPATVGGRVMRLSKAGESVAR